MADSEEEKQNVTRQLEESQKKLTDLRKTLEKALTSGDAIDSAAMVGEELQFREFNGHRYKVTTFDLDVSCQQCGQALVKRQGLFCLGCDHICHKECHTLGGLSCAERLELKDVVPMVFQACDEEERRKWIEGISALREKFLKSKA